MKALAIDCIRKAVVATVMIMLLAAPVKARCHYKFRHAVRVVTWYAAVPVIALLGGTTAVRLSINGLHDQNEDEDKQKEAVCRMREYQR
jgi:hypothetical protein